jgi:large subunit ribosomal protein L13
MRTYVAKPEEAQANRKWWVIDAKGQPLGRLAANVASILRGKHKPVYTPHVDTGDFVIVVNAAEVAVSGNKADKKKYYSYSGYPGGMKEVTFRQLIGRKPEAPIQKAVKGMLPKNVLGRQMFTKLKVYPTAEHPHVAQQPQLRELVK